MARLLLESSAEGAAREGKAPLGPAALREGSRMLDNKHNALSGNLRGSGGNPAASRAFLRRPGTAGPVRPQLIGQGHAGAKGGDFEDMMAAGRSQNSIIADVLDGPVSNQTQRQLAQLQAMNGRNPVLQEFERDARDSIASAPENAATSRRDPSKVRVSGRTGAESRGRADSGASSRDGDGKAVSAARGAAAGTPAGSAPSSPEASAASPAVASGPSAAGASSPSAPEDAREGPGAGAAGTSAAPGPVRRGAISLSAGPTILRGQGTGSIFNAARMAAYHQKYGPQLRMPVRLRPDPIPLGAAERLSGPPAPPKSAARTSNVLPKPRLKGSIPAVAAELAKSESGPSEEINATIRRAAEALGLDPALIRAVVKTESNFNPRAVSGAGAKGLMQLMPDTAKEMGVDNPFDPLENIWGGARYLKRMLDRSGGNLRRALASYNWGPGNVDRHGHGNLPRETRRYIESVTANYKRYRNQAEA